MPRASGAALCASKPQRPRRNCGGTSEYDETATRHRQVNGLTQAWRRLAALSWSRSHLVPVEQVGPEVHWARNSDLDALLTPGGPLPRLLVEEQPKRISLVDTLWRELSHGLDRPKMAALVAAADYTPADCHLARFRKAAAFPGSGLVMPTPGNLWAYSSFPARWGDPQLAKIAGIRVGSDGTKFHRSAWRAAPRIKERVALITTQFSYMYGHWLCDTISAVAWLMPAIRDGRVRLLAKPLTDWQRAVLDHLAVPRSSILERDEPIVRCDDLLVAASLGASDIGRPSLRQRQTFDALRRVTSTEGPALIYVARDRIVHPRTMTNEDEVISRLTDVGFTILRPERLSFEEQVRTFSQARVIAGAHGSGMGNIGLAPPGCIVLEVMPEDWVQAWTFRMCAVLGHRYVSHVADVDPCSRGEVAHDGNIRFPDGLWYRANVGVLVQQAQDIKQKIGLKA